MILKIKNRSSLKNASCSIQIIAAIVLAACRPADESKVNEELHSQEKSFTGKLSRVVVLGVALSEIVYDLNCGARVVAVDESCTTIPDYDTLPRVGYYRNFSAEGVLAQRPTLVLASSLSGPPAAIQQLKASGVPVAIIDESQGLMSVPQKIKHVASVLGCPCQAEGLAEHVERSLRTDPLAGVAPRVLFLMSPPGMGNWLAAGWGTVAQEVIEAAGGRNAVEGFRGYKPLSREAMVVMQPDLIVMPGDALVRAGGLNSVLDALGFSPDSAARSASVYEVDLASFLSTGSRIGNSVLELRNRLR